MLRYGCTRLEIGVQSVYEDVARDTNRQVIHVLVLVHGIKNQLEMKITKKAYQDDNKGITILMSMNTLTVINHHITYFLYAAFWQSSKISFAAVNKYYNNAHKYTQC